MEIFWRDGAIQDQIRDFIGLDNPDAAAQVADRLFATPDALGIHPHLGRKGRVPGTRELVVSGLPYIVAYAVVDNRVEVIGVRHTSRQWPTTFTPS